MNFLFIIQGEGRGHMTQAVSLAQALDESGHMVSEVLMGTSPQRIVPGFVKDYFGDKIRYFKSPNFIRTPDRKGINITLSLVYNIFRSPLYFWEIVRMARKISKSDAAVVVNFYDIIGGMANFFSFSNKPFYVISHQHYFDHPDFIWPERRSMQKILLVLYSFLCAAGADKKIALSFKAGRSIPDKKLYVVPPLLRKEIYNMKTSDGRGILVYLLNPGYVEDIKNWSDENKDEQLIVFTDSNDSVDNDLLNLRLEPLGGKTFLKALAGCEILVCTAGFETIAEGAYLGKRILIIPSKNHFEQECNAADAEKAGMAIKGIFFDPGLISGKKLPADHYLLKEWFDKNPEMIIDLISGIKKNNSDKSE